MAKVVYDHATKKFGDVTAVNNLGQETDLNSPIAELGRGGAIVDMADTIRPRAYMVYISGN